MLPKNIAGYTLQKALSSHKPQIERWRATGATGPAEVFIIPRELIHRYKTLPNWGPFSAFFIQEFSTSGLSVIIFNI